LSKPHDIASAGPAAAVRPRNGLAAALAARANGGASLRAAAVAGLVALLAIVALLTPGAFAEPAILSFLTSISFMGCVAVGMTLITISGNMMSFSLGATTGAAALVYVAALNDHGFWFAVTCALAFGALMSVAQGVLIAVARANPIIVSISASVLFYGAVQPATGGDTFYPAAPQPDWIHVKLFGVPSAFIAFLGVLALGQALLTFTVFGRRIYLIGNSVPAARAAGLNVPLTLLGVYFWAGLFAAIAGLMLATHYNRGSVEFGVGYDYSAIAAVLVGGTPLSGGEGSIWRTFAGVLIIGAVQVLLLLHGFRQEWQYLITGVIVLAVIVLNTRGRS
jgi:ribose/xylose/arabinose/galactoside ABC-type transport system permease subunit